MRRILLALLAGLLPGFASEREQQFAFALPEVEGRISLGVFDSAGKLRRTLYVNAVETDFVVGLNGLIAVWDGKDDFGQPLPGGQYQVRGYLVGDGLKAEGIAYHFNDWIDDEKSPRITRIDDFRKLPGGFLVLAETLDSMHPIVFRFDQLRGFLWTSPLSGDSPGLAARRIAARTEFKRNVYAARVFPGEEFVLTGQPPHAGGNGSLRNGSFERKPPFA